MAEKSSGRWTYVAGIVVLVAVVVIALQFRGGDEAVTDGGVDADILSDSGDAMVAHADGAAGELADGEASEEVVIEGDGAPSAGDAGCAANCAAMAERGDLRPGMTVDGCITALCGGAASGDGEPLETMSEGSEPAQSDCRVECQRLHGAGELRPGMNLEGCYSALCGE